MSRDNHKNLRSAIVAGIADLLEAHWGEARAAADDDGKFAVAFKASIIDGDPIGYVVTTTISRGTIKDEIRGSKTADDSPELWSVAKRRTALLPENA